ncbi:hypothetical protein GCM10009104_10900 [Marinobacterium maritimum]|uniref:YbgF trimerisation domain-containing protein n=2 Tax=Marinobacterium maritimum TaxID=500162 RepID=A0ABP3T716_9GAMM
MLQQLQDEVRALRGVIEQQQYRLDQLERHQRDRYRDMDKRISLLFQQLPQGAGTAVVGGADSVAADTQAAAEAAQSQVAPVDQASTEDAEQGAGEQQVYEAAFAKVRARNFGAAEAELKGFINQYPDSALQPNAWYWLGEVYLAQQNTADSEAAFARVVEQYAQHGKAADALYKLGVLSGRSGNAAKARQLMQQVVQEYPQAPAADLARGYLKP